MDKLEKAVGDREARIATLQQRINEVKDRIFAPFSKKVQDAPAILEQHSWF